MQDQMTAKQSEPLTDDEYRWIEAVAPRIATKLRSRGIMDENRIAEAITPELVKEATDELNELIDEVRFQTSDRAIDLITKLSRNIYRAMPPSALIYTDAPAAYDYGYTTEVDPCVATLRNKDRSIRLVAISGYDLNVRAQCDRYGSGLHIACNRAELIKLLRAGAIEDEDGTLLQVLEWEEQEDDRFA